MQYSPKHSRPKVAQYVRMSTELQRYSIDNQLEAIALYAATRGYEIVATYADEGRSGLTLRGRPALSRLLSDVKAADLNFEAILVLDISRWGRFQDPDQSATYEYFCRAAGVRVEYVAEGFANDDSVGAAILKHLKRVMAAEYSRELSDKVTAAVKMLARKGLRQGGMSSYGVRRNLFDVNGNLRGELQSGDRKYAKNDRVIVVHGPQYERHVVGKIFHQFVFEGLRMAEIARRLNAEGVLAVNKSTWTATSIRRVLTNPLNIGESVYNQSSRRLGTRKRINPKSEWIITKIFEPIVPPSVFAKAQQMLSVPYSNKISTEVLLSGLRKLLSETGNLSFRAIQNSTYVPSPHTYLERFGSLKSAFQIIGYERPRRIYRKPLRTKFSDEFLLGELRRLYELHGSISVKQIDNTPGLPGRQHYSKRFGSLDGACRLAGIPYDRRKAISLGVRLARGQILCPNLAKQVTS